MSSYQTLFITFVCLAYVANSLPQGSGRDEPGPVKDFAVPYHTTNSYIMSKLKSLYNYVFNKEESVHNDGYTKVYVMNKHMYYTYTHEFTPANEVDLDEDLHRITDDPILKQYMQNDAILKHRQEVQYHVQNKKLYKEQMAKTSQVYPQETFDPNLLKSDEKDSPEDGIMSRIKDKICEKILKSLPIFKRVQRDTRNKEDRDYKSQGVIKDNLRKLVLKVLGKPHSKISDNLKKEGRIVLSKMTDKLGEAKDNVKVALKNTGSKVLEGVKTAVVKVGTKIGQVVIPEDVRSMPWKEMREKVSEKLKPHLSKIKDFLNAGKH
ncbi:hypothetical protein M8J75_011643 [Diaphorina citri]|nr:hypothetical protein M8J75_011643 [Diaphorina citri]